MSDGTHDPAAANPAWDASRHLPPFPVLHLDGFDGPMDLLLDLAERQRIDFGRMSILALAEQFVAALQRPEHRLAIERRADWLVMATRLVLLRSRLLFPESPRDAEAAQRDAAAELQRIDELARMRAAAMWLERRPALGRDVLARGQPEMLGTSVGVQYEIDVIAFLWASLEQFDDGGAVADTRSVYRPAGLDLHDIPEARDRILQRLAEHPDGWSLEQLLPRTDSDATGETALRRCSAWTSTFVAGLELAKQGDAVLSQSDAFSPISVGRPAPGSAAPTA